MPAPGEREGVKGGEDPQRQEDHVSEFPETRPIEIEEHRARHGKPDAPPQAEKEMPEPGERQAQGRRKDRSPHYAILPMDSRSSGSPSKGHGAPGHGTPCPYINFLRAGLLQPGLRQRVGGLSRGE